MDVLPSEDEALILQYNYKTTASLLYLYCNLALIVVIFGDESEQCGVAAGTDWSAAVGRRDCHCVMRTMLTDGLALFNLQCETMGRIHLCF